MIHIWSIATATAQADVDSTRYDIVARCGVVGRPKSNLDLIGLIRGCSVTSTQLDPVDNSRFLIIFIGSVSLKLRTKWLQ